MDYLNDFKLFLGFRKPKPWTKVESTDLLFEIHVNCRSPNYTTWKRAREDIESHYEDIYTFTLEQIYQKEPGFNLVNSFYKEKEVKASLDSEASASAAEKQQWSKEKTVALFDEIDEKGSCGSDEQRFCHFYDVVSTVFRRQAQDGSLEEGMIRALDEFYQAGCPRVSAIRHRAPPLPQGANRVSPLGNSVSRAEERLAGHHGKMKQS